jgi:hypothetical protein
VFLIHFNGITASECLFYGNLFVAQLWIVTAISVVYYQYIIVDEYFVVALIVFDGFVVFALSQVPWDAFHFSYRKNTSTTPHRRPRYSMSYSNTCFFFASSVCLLSSSSSFQDSALLYQFLSDIGCFNSTVCDLRDFTQTVACDYKSIALQCDSQGNVLEVR